MLKEISIVCLSVLIIAGCSREEPPSEVIYARPLTPYHVVKAGETTLSIAQKYGMNEDVLIKINRLKSPYKLVPGQRLLVHAKADSQGSPIAPAKEGDIVVKPLVSAPDSAVSVASGTAAVVTMPTPQGPSNLTTEAPTVTDTVPSSLSSKATNGGYEWPVQGEVIQNFGQKLADGSTNDGINIRAPANVPVKAIADGTIKDAGARIPAYGNMVVLKHLDGKLSVYAHLSEISANVKQGAKIAKGQTIGRVGDTGVVKNNHQLYLQIRDEKLKPMDPTKLLP